MKSPRWSWRIACGSIGAWQCRQRKCSGVMSGKVGLTAAMKTRSAGITDPPSVASGASHGTPARCTARCSSEGQQIGELLDRGRAGLNADLDYADRVSGAKPARERDVGQLARRDRAGCVAKHSLAPYLGPAAWLHTTPAVQLGRAIVPSRVVRVRDRRLDLLVYIGHRLIQQRVQLKQRGQGGLLAEQL